MDREIKFRLYFHDKELNRLQYSTHKFEVTDKRLHIMLASFEENTIKGFVQFTGLKDKNGKEIYEGDIVKKEDPVYWVSSIGGDEPEPPDEDDIRLYRGGTAQVVATDFGYYMKHIDCGEWCFNGPEGPDWNYQEIEVIGNAFENPELITENQVESPQQQSPESES